MRPRQLIFTSTCKWMASEVPSTCVMRPPQVSQSRAGSTLHNPVSWHPVGFGVPLGVFDVCFGYYLGNF